VVVVVVEDDDDDDEEVLGTLHDCRNILDETYYTERRSAAEIAVYLGKVGRGVILQKHIGANECRNATHRRYVDLFDTLLTGLGAG